VADLFQKLKAAPTGKSYSAKDIEVLEGLEPVRRRPGMYIGGTDERSMHHLVAELLDNAMDEAVAGHADRIEIELGADGFVSVTDNGRGIPVDPHPKFRNKSALEVILTTLHSGGKFSDKVYHTAGGLHGVGLSVVNALSDELTVEVARDRELWRQAYRRGKPAGALKKAGAVSNRRGTTVRFHPDPEIFGASARFDPARLFRMARSKAYLFRGVEIRWSCAPALLKGAELAPGEPVPEAAVLHFPGGLLDFLEGAIHGRDAVASRPFAGEAALPRGMGRVEWACAWPEEGDGFLTSYCNTVPTPQGGSHEQGLRAALTRGLKAHGERVGNRRVGQITAEDVVDGACIALSLYVRDPQFQGQTKERLTHPEAQRLIEGTVKDHFDHWLAGDPEGAEALLEHVIARAEERLRRREAKDMGRKAATRKTRLPGKLADCTRGDAQGTEIFLVEGDSAGGSAKQARDREIQAVLPLRGKILNVASASSEKLHANQELRDLVQALGCGVGAGYDDKRLRYDRVIVMTDADVDGAHIASLLMTFFYQEMRGLIASGHLFLALPPLYRLSQGGKTIYARDDAHRERLLKSEFKANAKVEVSRFKGLGEMPSQQLKETTMDPARRVLLRVVLPDAVEDKQEAKKTAKLVESLMGRKPELRLAFIQEKARFVRDLDI
jgi:topoisomerase-4 subunit B